MPAAYLAAVTYFGASYNSFSETTGWLADSLPPLLAAPNIGPLAGTTGAKAMNPVGCGTSS